MNEIEPIRLRVTDEIIKEAHEHIERLKKCQYNNNHLWLNCSWKGIAAEILCSNALKKYYKDRMTVEATGINSKSPFSFDIMIDGYKIDIKCGTNLQWRTICPSAKGVENYASTKIYFGCLYREIKGSDDIVEVYGAISRKTIMTYPRKSHHKKSLPFYQVPVDELSPKILYRLKSNI